jgi:hypothetical protein
MTNETSFLFKHSWGGIVEHVTHSSLTAAVSGGTAVNQQKQTMEQKIHKDNQNDKRLMKNQLITPEQYRTNAQKRDTHYVNYVLNTHSEETPCLRGRKLGVLGDGSVRSFTNSPSLIACRAQTELNTHHRRLHAQQQQEQQQQEQQEQPEQQAQEEHHSKTISPAPPATAVASLAQRRATAVSVSFFLFFVCFALFIDLLTDKVQPLSR